MSDFPSLMSSLMNLLVLSSSASCDLSVSRKCGLSRQQSLNSSAGSPMLPAAPGRGARFPEARAAGSLGTRPGTWPAPSTAPAPQVWRRSPERGVCGAPDRRAEPSRDPGEGRLLPSAQRSGGGREARRLTRSGAGKRAGGWRARPPPPRLPRWLAFPRPRAPSHSSLGRPAASGPLEPASDDLIPPRQSARSPQPDPRGRRGPPVPSATAIQSEGLEAGPEGGEAKPPPGSAAPAPPSPARRGLQTRSAGRACCLLCTVPRHPGLCRLLWP